MEISSLKTCVLIPAGIIASSNTTHSSVWKLNDWYWSQCGWRTMNVHPFMLELPTIQKFKGNDDNNFLTSWKSSRRRGFLPQNIVWKPTYFFGYIHVFHNVIFISEGKYVLPLAVWGKRKLKLRSSCLPQKDSRIILQNKFLAEQEQCCSHEMSEPTQQTLLAWARGGFTWCLHSP